MSDAIAELGERMDAGFAAINVRLDGIDGRLDGIDEHLKRTDGRLDGIDGRLDGIDERLNGIDEHLKGADARLDGIDGRLDGVDERLNGIDGRLDGIDECLKGVDGRLGRLEASVDRHALLLEEQGAAIKQLAESILIAQGVTNDKFVELAAAIDNRLTPLETVVRERLGLDEGQA